MNRPDEAGQAKLLSAERNLAPLRVVSVALLAIVIAATRGEGATSAVVPIVAGLAVYSILALALAPVRRFPAWPASVALTITDNALLLAWLAATGGFDSPYFLLLVISVFVTAYRFGPREPIVAAVLQSAAYAGIAAWQGQLAANAAEMGIRVGFMLIASVLASAIARAHDAAARRTLEMRNLTAMLDQEVSRRTAALEASEHRLRESLEDVRTANERLQEMDRAKTQFLNTASHELRTPLTPIKVQLHLLKSQSFGDLNPRQDASLGVIDRNIERLGGLIEDLLDIARIQAGRMPLRREPLDIDRVVDEAAQSFDEPAKRQGVRLDVRRKGPPVVVDADPARLLQVLFNYLSNALKFTPAGGSVTVNVTRAGDDAEVTVVDTGNGLRPEDIAKLFQPFSQLHDTMQRTNAGAGLGLYICKGIIEQHGGRVWAESGGPGAGATFGFAVPVHRDTAARIPPSPPAAATEKTAPPLGIADRARELL